MSVNGTSVYDGKRNCPIKYFLKDFFCLPLLVEKYYCGVI